MIFPWRRTALLLALLEAWNRSQVGLSGPLGGPLPGEARWALWDEGRLWYTVAGPEDAPPLLLIHGINAAASSYEMRKQLQSPLTDRFRVYALDLLGFGQSDRPPLPYSPALYIRLLRDFIHDVIAAPTHIIASSLSAAWAISLKAEDQRRGSGMVGRLALVAPTGLTELVNGSTGGDLLYQLFRLPIVGKALFNGLVSRPSLHFFLLRNSYYWARAVTPELVRYHEMASHQPGARWAPAAFVAGRLNHNVLGDWPAIDEPTLLLWGANAAFTPVAEGRRFLELNTQATLYIFERCGMLPHDEYAERFNAMVADFLSGKALPDNASAPRLITEA